MKMMGGINKFEDVSIEVNLFNKKKKDFVKNEQSRGPVGQQ